MKQMFEINIYERPHGTNSDMKPVRKLPYLFVERAEAIQLIEQRTKSYDNNGRNPEQDYWWCRNANDCVNQVLVIDSASS